MGVREQDRICRAFNKFGFDQQELTFLKLADQDGQRRLMLMLHEVGIHK